MIQGQAVNTSSGIKKPKVRWYRDVDTPTMLQWGYIHAVVFEFRLCRESIFKIDPISGRKYLSHEWVLYRGNIGGQGRVQSGTVPELKQLAESLATTNTKAQPE